MKDLANVMPLRIPPPFPPKTCSSLEKFNMQMANTPLAFHPFIALVIILSQSSDQVFLSFFQASSIQSPV